ncbi:MAG: hypothetical protein V3R25_10095 [Nitrosomonadaceae bacterium]
MTAQSQGPSNSYPIDKPSTSKASESADIAAQMAEWEAINGDVETSPIKVYTVADLKPKFRHTLSNGKSPGPHKKDKK